MSNALSYVPDLHREGTLQNHGWYLSVSLSVCRVSRPNSRMESQEAQNWQDGSPSNG